MFTFSFGSAFAAFGDDYTESLGDQYFELMWADLVKVTVSEPTVNVVTADATYAVDKTVLNGFKAEAKAIYDYYMLNSASDYLDEADDLANAVLDLDNSATDNVKTVAFKKAVAKAQFAADKTEALAVLNSIPTYNYSTEVMSAADALVAYGATSTPVISLDKDITYQAAAEKIVAYFVEKVEDCDDFDADVTVKDYKDAADTIATILYYNVLPMGYATYNADGEVTALALTGTYDLVAPYASASKAAKDAATGFTFPVAASEGKFFDVNKDVNSWGIAAVDAANKTTAASVAAVKAMNAAKYAEFVVGADAATVKYADKWLKAADKLAEAGYGYGAAYANQISAPDANLVTYKTVGEYLAKLEAYAARYGAEKNADGELIRDAAVVEKYLAKGLIEIAKAGDANAETKYNEYTGYIANAKSATIAAELAFVKESIKKAAELLVADAIEDEVYYAAELADVQEYVATYLAKVEAADTADAAKTAYNTMINKINGVDTAKELYDEYSSDISFDANSAAYAVYAAAAAYESYYDTNIAKETSEELDKTTLKDRIIEMIGESGYRTATEIKTLKEQAVAVAQGLPTNAAVKAAKKAVEAAIKALPAKATIADFAAVQAVSDAIDAYEELVGTNDVDDTAYDAAIGYIEAAYNTQFAQKFATTVKTDEAALNALYAEIEAAIDAIEALTVEEGDALALGYMKTMLTSIENYITAIQEAADLAVEKLIAAIPINVTEADIATVEAARAAYDAYVAKYTDYEALYNEGNYTDGFAADDITGVDILTAAETVLGLNDNSEEIAKLEAIASVEGLKITAKSSAKKGAITVKWTVEGDDANVQYYEVRKSTKKNSGFGTKPYFTTTKMTYKNTKGLEAGTRYYFKVRAVAEIDGEVYVSDWSNKAYRVAK